MRYGGSPTEGGFFEASVYIRASERGASEERGAQPRGEKRRARGQTVKKTKTGAREGGQAGEEKPDGVNPSRQTKAGTMEGGQGGEGAAEGPNSQDKRKPEPGGEAREEKRQARGQTVTTNENGSPGWRPGRERKARLGSTRQDKRKREPGREAREDKRQARGRIVKGRRGRRAR